MSRASVLTTIVLLTWAASTAAAGYTRNILITGYWPPTNEMLRQFSPNELQNPGGWVGENWEGRGYNVYAYFPEFPFGFGQGVGDFEIDYQDTSNDWWEITSQVNPVGIITFSRSNTNNGWELEGGNRTYSSAFWTNDYEAPRRPTADLPIMEEPHLNERFSSLPMQRIVNAVRASGADVDPFINPIDNSRYLSNFIGYHGNWYHDMHSDPLDEYWNVAAGHIHVGQGTDLSAAEMATEVTLRVLIDHLDRQINLAEANGWLREIPEPSTAVLLVLGGLMFVARRRA